jgi:predicted DNA-binding transcriptional regulator AlpA
MLRVLDTSTRSNRKCVGLFLRKTLKLPPIWREFIFSHIESMSADSFYLLKSTAVMAMLGYKDRKSFWIAVRRDGIPHTRLNSRNIQFPEQALRDWLQRRSTVRSFKS